MPPSSAPPPRIPLGLHPVVQRLAGYHQDAYVLFDAAAGTVELGGVHARTPLDLAALMAADKETFLQELFALHFARARRRAPGGV